MTVLSEGLQVRLIATGQLGIVVSIEPYRFGDAMANVARIQWDDGDAADAPSPLWHESAWYRIEAARWPVAVADLRARGLTPAGPWPPVMPECRICGGTGFTGSGRCGCQGAP